MLSTLFRAQRYNIRYVHEQTDRTLYVLIFNDAGQAWNGSDFVEFDGDNSTYGNPLSEDLLRTGFYYASLDPLPPGTYDEEIWRQAGVAPDRSADLFIAVQEHYWCGGVDAPIHEIAIGNRTGQRRWVYRVLDPLKKPVYNVHVTACLDENGYQAVAAGTTNQEGECVLWLTDGETYYIFRRSHECDLENPEVHTIP